MLRTKTIVLLLALIIILFAAVPIWLYVALQKPGDISGVSTVRWEFDGTNWRALGTPPACLNPLQLTTPVELNRATAVLYPGQTRGGDFKPHGGFRFDKSKSTDITVRAPLDAVVARGSRYIENGEPQYLFEFIAPCGLMYRFDHLRTLAPKLAQLANQFPPAKEGDTRTTQISSTITVAKGEVLATAVGFPKKSNISVDWGVYDLRNKNAAAKNPTWAKQHNSELGHYALCWLDALSAGDRAKVRSLPAGDSTSGKKSDYCK